MATNNPLQDQMNSLVPSGSLGLKMDVAEATTDIDVGAALTGQIPEKATTKEVITGEAFKEKKPTAITDVTKEMEPANVPIVNLNVGAGMVTDRKVKIDWLLANPSVSVTSVMDFTLPAFKKKWMEYDALENAQGETLNLAGMDESTRIDRADKFGAVKMIRYDDDIEGGREVIDIPWEEKLVELTRVPEDVSVGPAKLDVNSMTYPEYRRLRLANRAFSTLATPDPKLGTALHAAYLNEVLIENGIDERGRYLIINDALKNPTLDELKRVAGFTESIGRFAVEMPLYMAGEAIDFATFYSGSMLGDYHHRQDIVDAWWRPTTYNIQDKWAEQNVIIDLATAEDLASAYTGAIPRAAKLAGEIVGPTKFEIGRRSVYAGREGQQYNLYKQGALRKNPELTEDAIIKGFEERRARDLKFGTKSMRENRIRDRLTLHFQISDAGMAVPERAEVRRHIEYTAGLTKRKNALVASREKNYRPQLDSEIDKVDSLLEDAQHRLFAIQRQSSVPKAFRDLNVQNNYMVAGAATVGHFFGEEMQMVDSELGDLIGFGVGFAVAIAEGNTANGLTAIGSRLPGGKARRMRYFVKEAQRADPELQKVMVAQSEKIAEYQDKLVAAGVDPTLLSLTLPVITDLVTLRHFENAINTKISLKDAISSEDATNIQKASDLNKRLNGELNKILSEMQVNTEADKEFFNMVDAFRKSAIESARRLDVDINAAEKGAVAHYMGGITGRTSAVDPLSPLTADADDIAEVKSFPEAVSSLNKKSLLDNSALPSDQFESTIRQNEEFVAENITLAANEARSRIGTPEQARKTTGMVLGESNVARTSPSGLHSMHLENAHSAQRTIAMQPYEYLKGPDVQYVDGNNMPVSGVPTVDAQDVFGTFFNVPIPGTRQLSRITDTDLDASDLNIMDGVMVELTDQFFMAQAQAEGITKKQLVTKMKKKYVDEGKAFPDGRKDQSMIAQYIIEEAAQQGFALPFFEMNPVQIRELQSAVNSLQWKYRLEGETTKKLQNISTLIDSKFDDFQIDGQNIGTLGVVTPNGETMELGKYMQEANDGWREYKSVWYDDVDGGRIPALMSWGNRKKHPVDAAHPGGTAYTKPVDEFLVVDELIDPTKANRLMLSLSKAFGKKMVGPDGRLTSYLISGDKNTLAIQSYMKAMVGEYLHEAIRAGKMTQQEIGEAVLAIEKNIQVLNPTTNQMNPAFSVMQVLDDAINFSSDQSISTQLRKQSLADSQLKIKKAVSAAVAPAKKRKEGLEDAAVIAQGFGAGRIDASQIGDQIRSGGRVRYDQLRNALRDTRNADGSLKYTEQDVDQIIADSYLLAARKNLFTPTGRKRLESSVDAQGNSTKNYTDELQENPAALREMLGTTPEEQRLVMDILGKERYEVWEAVSGFMAELQNNPLAGSSGLATKGMPRAMSVESYISRLYAINRGVVRPQYVGTEAALQQLRHTKAEFILSVLNDPELGREFLEMVRAGSPLDPKRNARFEGLLISSSVMVSNVFGAEEKVVVDTAGRKFTIHANTSERTRFGTDIVRDKDEFFGRAPISIPSLDTLPN